MANEIFMTQWFSEQMRLAGEALIKKLDQTGAQVQDAFWILDAEQNNWKLTIVSPLVESDGSKNYYRRIDYLNEAAKPDEDIIALHDIRVSNTDNRIIKALNLNSLKGAILKNVRLGKNAIGGIYIEDMYLYRMDWELLPQKTA